MNQAQQGTPQAGQPNQESVVVFPMAVIQQIGNIAMEAPTKFGAPILELLKQGQLGNLGNGQPAAAAPNGSVVSSEGGNSDSTGSPEGGTTLQ